MKNLFFAAALCVALALPAHANKIAGKPAGLQKTAVYSVSKMECEGCSKGLQAGLTKEKGVSDAKVDFKSKRATLRYDARQTNAKKLEKAFARKGFPAKLVTR